MARVQYPRTFPIIINISSGRDQRFIAHRAKFSTSQIDACKNVQKDNNHPSPLSIDRTHAHKSYLILLIESIHYPTIFTHKLSAEIWIFESIVHNKYRRIKSQQLYKFTICTNSIGCLSQAIRIDHIVEFLFVSTVIILRLR